jgi:hypothetical protein
MARRARSSATLLRRTRNGRSTRWSDEQVEQAVHGNTAEEPEPGRVDVRGHAGLIPSAARSWPWATARTSCPSRPRRVDGKFDEREHAAMPTLTKIRPCLWFDTEAEEAATSYTGIFENSRILHVSHYGSAGPRPDGMVMGARHGQDRHRRGAARRRTRLTDQRVTALAWIGVSERREFTQKAPETRAGVVCVS